MSWSMLKGDMRDVLSLLETASVDSIVCDPPYGLSKEPDIFEVMRHWIAGDDYVHRGGGFMGKSWDSFVPGPSCWRECYRVLKPGGYLIAFGGTRTYDLLVVAIRMAGFEVRDQLQWLYGQGFPKSRNIAKDVDKIMGQPRPVAGRGEAVDRNALDWGGATGKAKNGLKAEWDDHPANTDEARSWEGWGTALKPAHEPIVFARKPFKGTVAANVLAHSTGALNVDGCRIGFRDADDEAESKTKNRHADFGSGARENRVYGVDNRARGENGNYDADGRWPANVVLGHHEECRLVGARSVASDGHFPAARPQGSQVSGSSGHAGQEDLEERHTRGEMVDVWECVDDCPVRLLDAQTGTLKSGDVAGSVRHTEGGNGLTHGAMAGVIGHSYADSGGASRFFYCAKTSTSERNLGLPEGMKNEHSTVKPIALMRWLTRLVTPPGGFCLDPFAGSGSTGCGAALEGFDFLGVELAEEDPTVIDVANYRISYWNDKERTDG